MYLRLYKQIIFKAERHKRLDSSETSINLYVKNKKKNKGNPGDQTILH